MSLHCTGKILFVKKKSRSLQGLNEDTIKSWYYLPLMLDILIQIRRGGIYTNLDISNGYNILSIAHGEE